MAVGDQLRRARGAARARAIRTRVRRDDAAPSWSLPPRCAESHAAPLAGRRRGKSLGGRDRKTPLAAWIARRYAGRGRVPGILLRGYGGDEPLVHRRLAPDAVVVADPNRVAGAERARAAGADILVLDDAFQLLSVARDLNIAVVSAESIAGSPWPLPAGPWRERWDALARADVIVVTRKRVPAAVADRLPARRGQRTAGSATCVAHLAVGAREGM